MLRGCLGAGSVSFLRALVDGNHFLIHVMTVAGLLEGVFTTKGATRTRIKWGVFIFASSFILFPFQILVLLPTRASGADFAGPQLIDYSLQLILPLGHEKGRPVGLAMDSKGALLVADDIGNTVWRINGAGQP